MLHNNVYFVAATNVEVWISENVSIGSKTCESAMCIKKVNGYYFLYVYVHVAIQMKYYIPLCIFFRENSK